MIIGFFFSFSLFIEILCEGIALQVTEHCGIIRETLLW